VNAISKKNFRQIASKEIWYKNLLRGVVSDKFTLEAKISQANLT